MLELESFCPLTDELRPVRRLTHEASRDAVAACVRSWTLGAVDFRWLLARAHVEYLDLPTGEACYRVTCPQAVSDWRRVG